MNTDERPKKYNLLGVGISATTYEEVVRWIVTTAKRELPGIVTAFPVHGVVTASRDPSLRSKVNSFDIVTPDGQPVRWSLNYLHRTKLTDRVYGPELMLRVCRSAAEEGIGIYLYGSLPQVLVGLRGNLTSRYPSLRILGAESPPFRPLTDEEDRETVDRINGSGARLIFLGLGCPRQDLFAFDHRDTIRGIQISVGAAFDFIAGNKKMAPSWMQRNGLEWLFRLTREPGRLWKRYLYTNTLFLGKIFLEASNRKGK